MRRAGMWIVISVVGVLLLSGCQNMQGPGEPSQTRCVSPPGRQQAMKAAEAVLRDMQFTIEKFDIERGIIRTRGLSAAQFFELWRKDTPGAFNVAEANLHSLEKSVQLDVSGGASEVCMDCRVNIRRLSIPERNNFMMGRLPSMYTSGNRDMQELEFHQRADVRWIDMGRDGDLERKILTLIEKRLAKSDTQRGSS